MQKTILITGSTDGIGLATAKALAAKDHHVLIHGRNPEKIKLIQQTLSDANGAGHIESYVADLSRPGEVLALANAVSDRHDKLDVLVNNAGIYKTPNPITPDGLDVRFAVNTIAPYLLTQKLMPLLTTNSRVINVASAAQSPVNPEALTGKITFSNDMNAYAQSKLALIMWSQLMGNLHKPYGPIFIAVNPGSLLATKMVREGLGMTGNDVHIGSGILTRLALDNEFTTATGQYFDNDAGRFNSPHADTLDTKKVEEIVKTLDSIIQNLVSMQSMEA